MPRATGATVLIAAHQASPLEALVIGLIMLAAAGLNLRFGFSGRFNDSVRAFWHMGPQSDGYRLFQNLSLSIFFGAVGVLLTWSGISGLLR